MSINQNIRQVPITSPVKGVNTVVNREGQPPDTCWNALNMLPYDRYGRRRVSQRPGLTIPFVAFSTGTFIQNMLTVNNIVYAGTASTAPSFANGGIGGVPLFTSPALGPGGSFSFSGPDFTTPPRINFYTPFSITFTTPTGTTSVSLLKYGVDLYNGINYETDIEVNTVSSSNTYTLGFQRNENTTPIGPAVSLTARASGNITIHGNFLGTFDAATGDFNFTTQITSQTTTGTNIVPLSAGTYPMSALNVGALNFGLNSAAVVVGPSNSTLLAATIG